MSYNPDMEKEVGIFIQAVQAAKSAVLQSSNSALNDSDNVQTKADILAQESIIEILQENDISCQIYSEELEEPLILGDSRYEVILDPLDGSFLYLHGIRAFGSITMMVLEQREVKYAFVQSIADDNLYYCDPTSAYLNGKKINCEDQISEPYLITGYAAKKHLLPWVSKIENVSANFHFLDYGGSLSASMVGSNNIDANIEFEPAPFHEYAGAMVAQKAGAFVERIEGGAPIIDPSVKQSLIVSRSEKLLKELQSTLR